MPRTVVAGEQAISLKTQSGTEEVELFVFRCQIFVLRMAHQDKRVSRYQPDAKSIAKIGILKHRRLENVVGTLRSREWAGEQMNRPDIVLARAVICIGRPNNDGPCSRKAANIDVGCGPAIAKAVWKQLVREGLA